MWRSFIHTHRLRVCITGGGSPAAALWWETLDRGGGGGGGEGGGGGAGGGGRGSSVDLSCQTSHQSQRPSGSSPARAANRRAAAALEVRPPGCGQIEM